MKKIQTTMYVKSGDVFYLRGLSYEYGDGNNISPDPEKAEYFYRKSFAKNQNIDSLISIARLMYSAKKYPKAFDLYKALESKKIPVVYISLGRFYEFGLLGEKNISQAEYYYKKAYDLGNLFGCLYYTRIQFSPGTERSVLDIFKNFFIHQFVRIKIEYLSIKDKFDVRLQQY